MINLIIFGPPGSGKGTQAEKLERKYNLVHISTGDIFRSEIAEGSELGVRASEFMSKGELVPDEVTIGMLRKKMMAHKEAEGFVFDGFPRTDPQADALDNLLGLLDQQIDVLIMLDVPEDEIVKRIVLRSAESGRADDSDESIIRNRFQVYQNQTEPIYSHYHAKGRAHKISGMGSIDDIFQKICDTINSIHV
jgi:adenylate kinase